MEKYGNRSVVKMYNKINNLRKLIRAEGSPAIQEAWEQVEQFIDIVFTKNE